MQEQQERKRGPVTEERLVRAVEVLAELVKQHGPAYGPLYDTLEHELTTFRERHQSLKAPAEQLTQKHERKVA
jgi:hypothetical protein